MKRLETLEDKGIVTINGKEWRLQERYPNPKMRNYKFLSAYCIETSESTTFPTDHTFYSWLRSEIQPETRAH